MSKQAVFYKVEHHTQIHYSFPIRENIMQVVMKPVTTKQQKLISHQLNIDPKAPIFEYQDHLGNQKQYFNIIKKHQDLKIESISQVQVEPFPEDKNETAEEEWKALEALQSSVDFWYWLKSSSFIKVSSFLSDFIKAHNIHKAKDPLTSLILWNRLLFYIFQYSPKSTHVHSNIDEILQTKKGVCQDYSQVMIGIARFFGIPARYVSGYLYERPEDQFTSENRESHAWLECYIPSLGWLGFDPTNNKRVGWEYIKLGIGQDYYDVPPHKGFFKGQTGSQLKVSVVIEKQN